MNFNLKTLAFAATLALASQAALAASYNFSGITDPDEPLPLQTFNGQFSYDESLLTLVGKEYADLSSWSLSAFGQTYSFAGADAAPRAAFNDGQLLGVEVSYSAGGSVMGMVSSPFGVADAFLVYRNANGFERTASYTVSAVPEPSSWALSLAGILAVGAVVRRRRLGA